MEKCLSHQKSLRSGYYIEMQQGVFGWSGLTCLDWESGTFSRVTTHWAFSNGLRASESAAFLLRVQVTKRSKGGRNDLKETQRDWGKGWFFFFRSCRRTFSGDADSILHLVGEDAILWSGTELTLVSSSKALSHRFFFRMSFFKEVSVNN